MGYKKCLSLLALFVLSSISLSVLSSTGANASSVYDGAIRQTETLSIISPNGAFNTSIADGQDTSWYHIAQESLCAQGFNIAFQNGDYAVSQVIADPNYGSNYGGAGGHYVVVTFDHNNNAGTSSFDISNSSSVFTTPNETTQIVIRQQNNGNISKSCTETQLYGFELPVLSSSGDVSAGLGTFVYLYRYYGFSVVYPPDYNGPTPVDVNPVPPNSKKPDIYMSSMNNFVGTFSDRNFFTFDGIPFTCGEFVPQINVEVWTTHGESNETLLDSLSTSASSQFNYTFPTSPQTNDYRIVSYYSCPELSFNEVSFYDFQINSSGGLVAGIPCTAELFCSLNIPTYGLTTAILAPLAFVAQLPTQDCTPLNLPMPYLGDIYMPCMTPIYQTYLGTTFLIFQTIMVGLFAYYISIRTFGTVKDLTNPRDDQVETVKL